MICIDSSALIAIATNEPELQRCADIIDAADGLCMSAASVTEVMIVALGRGVADEVAALIDELKIEVVPLSAHRAERAWRAYGRWGKGFHKAKLNYGDSFSYSLAIERGCPLLFVGNDFALTDVIPA